ncbi:MAG: amidohydrolase family protein [Actinomycetota bacterium]|nr:amidohydrolase family protein [Actinomycetota bacterium]MDQ2956882.1 amidohydrolase family protein [Actinomycetota bacterium]
MTEALGSTETVGLTRLEADWLFTGSGPLVRSGVVVVQGDTILAAGSSDDVGPTPGAAVRRLGDVTLMPGMIDVHVHLTGERQYGRVFPNHALEALRAAQDARRLLFSGFTTVRDCGSNVSIALRDTIAEGTTLGPTVVAAGPAISQTGGHTDWHALPYELMKVINDRMVVDGETECRKVIRRLVRERADFIKICTTGGVGTMYDHMLDEHFTVHEITVMVEEAHRANRRVAAHAQGKAGILNAVRAGVDTVEHGYFLDQECVDEMLARGTMLVPTFGLSDIFRETLKTPEMLPPWRREKQPQCLAAMEASFPLAWQAGIPIAVGSDSIGMPGREFGKSAEEVISMVKSGGLPTELALEFATRGGARAIGRESEIGAFAPGMNADVIAVHGRPTDEIENLRRVQFVMKNGAVIKEQEGEPIGR